MCYIHLAVENSSATKLQLLTLLSVVPHCFMNTAGVQQYYVNSRLCMRLEVYDLGTMSETHFYQSRLCLLKT